MSGSLTGHRSNCGECAGALAQTVAGECHLGREAFLIEWVIFEEECYRAAAPGQVSQNGNFLLAPILFDHGTPEQQDRHLPRMATGEQVRARGRLRPGLAEVDGPARRARRLGP